MRTLTIAFIAAAALPLTALAETPEQKGLAIAVEAQKRNEGWVDSRVDAKMVLENKQGEKSERNMRLRALEVISATDGDKSLTYFLSPADVQGTALLSFTHFKTPDDQWLYLPALKRVKRIASANKSGSFVGSEFAFEDLLAQEVERARRETELAFAQMEQGAEWWRDVSSTGLVESSLLAIGRWLKTSRG